MKELEVMTIAPRCLRMVELQDDMEPGQRHRRPAGQQKREHRQPGATAWAASAAVFITALCTLDTPGPAGIAAGIAAGACAALWAVWGMMINRQ